MNYDIEFSSASTSYFISKNTIDAALNSLKKKDKTTRERLTRGTGKPILVYIETGLNTTEVNSELTKFITRNKYDFLKFIVSPKSRTPKPDTTVGDTKDAMLKGRIIFVPVQGLGLKKITRLKHLFTDMDYQLGKEGFGIRVRDTSELQKLRDLESKFPVGAKLHETYKSPLEILIESDTTEREVVSLLVSNSGTLGDQDYINQLAIDLATGSQGDVVLDDKGVWVYTDSKEHAKRIIQDILYSSKFPYYDEELLKITPKYANRLDFIQEESSFKIKVENFVSPENAKKYSNNMVNRHFYFKNEYLKYF